MVAMDIRIWILLLICSFQIIKAFPVEAPESEEDEDSIIDAPSSEEDSSGPTLELSEEEIDRLMATFSWLNVSFAENCYFHQREWMSDQQSGPQDSYCHMVAHSTHPGLPYLEDLIYPLQVLYSDYSQNEPQDRSRIYQCFVRSRQAGNDTTRCLEAIQTSDDPDLLLIIEGVTTQRERNGKAYLDQLIAAQAQIDHCNTLAKPFSKGCGFMNERDLIEHCARFHRWDEWGKCKKISWARDDPLHRPPTDARTMFRLDTWNTVEAEKMQFLESLRKTHPKRYQVMTCMHTTDWLIYSDHICYGIMDPVKGKKYSTRTRKLQKMFQEQKQYLLRDDCASGYHKGVKRCKNIPKQ